MVVPGPRSSPCRWCILASARPGTTTLVSVAAPDYVPIDPTAQLRAYSSPPRRVDSWTGGRPGELNGPQPKGPALGAAGPDQGYAYRLVRHLEDRIHPGDLDRDDVVAGCVALAMRRSSLMGRAPVIHDLTAAFTIYGFMDPTPDDDLVELRTWAFSEVASHHHYFERRHLVDRVREDVLRKSHNEIAKLYSSDWRQSFLDISSGGSHP